jgi:AraC-like DNA-binding protein
MSRLRIPPVDPKHGPTATPSAFVQAIVLAYRRYGVDPGNALRTAQIAPDLLERPEARFTAAQMEIMSAVAMQELDDEALGWFSRKLPWGTYGMLCRASLTSPDLGVALKRWCRHHRLLTDDILIEFTSGRSHAALTIRERIDLGPMRELCLVTSLRYVLGYACWAIDSRIPLLEAHFPYEPPPHREAYALMFPGPVRFGADTAGVQFDPSYLRLALQRDEKSLQVMLQRALPLTVLQYRRDRLLIQRVRQALQSQIHDDITADAVAGRLNTSTRTLHRQLREEGASLQDLKDEVRRDRAIDLLNRTAWPVKKIALAVGYRNEKSFSRAFKEWTGQAPNRFRDSHS